MARFIRGNRMEIAGDDEVVFNDIVVVCGCGHGHLCAVVSKFLGRLEGWLG